MIIVITTTIITLPNYCSGGTWKVGAFLGRWPGRRESDLIKVDQSWSVLIKMIKVFQSQIVNNPCRKVLQPMHKSCLYLLSFFNCWLGHKIYDGLQKCPAISLVFFHPSCCPWPCHPVHLSHLGPFFLPCPAACHHHRHHHPIFCIFSWVNFVYFEDASGQLLDSDCSLSLHKMTSCVVYCS